MLGEGCKGEVGGEHELTGSGAGTKMWGHSDLAVSACMGWRRWVCCGQVGAGAMDASGVHCDGAALGTPGWPRSAVSQRVREMWVVQ